MAKKVEKSGQVKKAEGRSFFKDHKWELFIFAFSILIYANAISNDYNMDDELVTINHRLTSKGVSAIPEIFTTTYYKDDMGYAYEYRPMVLASFAIEHQLFGDNALISHLFNILLYGLCCILLYRVLLLVTKTFSVLVPLGITFLFIAHPAHTEVVCSIKNRDEILGLIFSLLTWLAVFKAVKGNYKWYVLVPLFFIAALMSKLSVLPFNLIIPLAVILFTEARFKNVLAVSLLLALSSFIVLNNFLYDKLIVTMGMVGVTLMLFVFVRFKQVSAWVTTFFKETMVKPGLPAHNQIGNPISENVKDFYTSLRIDYTAYLSFWPMTITFAAAVIYLIGAVITFPVMMIIGGAALFILVLFGNEKTAWWATILLYACLLAGFYKYQPGNSIYIDFLAVCLVYQMVYGKRSLFIPSLIIFIPLTLQSQITVLNCGAAALIAYRWKWTRPVAVIFLLLGIYSSYYGLLQFPFLSRASFHTDRYEVFVGLAVIITLLVQRGTKTLITLFPALAIVALLTMDVVRDPIVISEAGHNIKTQITQIDKKVKTNLISEKVDRPISFVEQPVTSMSPVQLRLGTAFGILFMYLHKVVLPYPMSFYYGYQFITPQNITDTIPLLSLCLYIILILLAMFCLIRYKLIGFGIMIYLLSIASVSTYFYPIPGQLGERFLFIASLGWSIVFVVGLTSLFKAGIPVSGASLAAVPKTIKYPFAVVLCLYSVITFSRNFDWKDYSTLANHDIEYVQNSAQANNLVALNMMKKSYEIQDVVAQKQMRVEALAHFKKALNIYPGFYNVTYDIGRVFNVLNEKDSSVAYFKKALAIDSTNPNPALFIGQMLSEQGRYKDAVPYLQYVIDHHPADYTAFEKLSFAYFKLQDYNSSIAVNQKAIAVLSPQTNPYINIAHVYMSLNMADSARTYLKRALQVNGNDANAMQILQQIGDK